MRKELRPNPRRRQLRRLRAHDPQGRAHGAVSGPGRAAQARLRAVHGAGRPRGLDPRVRARRHARRAPPARAAALADRAPAARTRGARGRRRRSRRPRAGRGLRPRSTTTRSPSRRRARARAAASAAPAEPPQGPAPRARGAHQRAGEGRARARGLQRLGAHAHDLRHRPHPRRPVGQRDPAHRGAQRGGGRGGLGAVLVPLSRSTWATRATRSRCSTRARRSTELDESQREWNAVANEDGQLGAGVVSGER